MVATTSVQGHGTHHAKGTGKGRRKRGPCWKAFVLEKTHANFIILHSIHNPARAAHARWHWQLGLFGPVIGTHIYTGNPTSGVAAAAIQHWTAALLQHWRLDVAIADSPSSESVGS